MPRSKENTYHALKIFKELSEETEKFTDDIPSESKFDEWVESVMETFIKIRDCNCVNDVQYGFEIGKLFVSSNVSKPIEGVDLAEQRTHLHATPASDEPKTGPSTPKQVLTNATESSKLPVSGTCPNQSGFSTPKRSSRTRVTNKAVLSTPLQTPVLASIAEPRVLATPSTNSVLSAIPVHMRVAKKTYQKSQPSGSECPDLTAKGVVSAVNNSPVMSSTPVNPHPRTKRKSSVEREESSKKMKENVQVPMSRSSKPGKSKNKGLRKLVAHKTVDDDSSGKKNVAYIVPVAPKKISVVSKELQILEDIKKKEAKANENRKKLLAEKQLKVEENKKKREERLLKMVEKKQQMEKKQQLDNQKAQPVKELKKPPKAARVKELVEQHSKENVQAAANSAENTKVKTDIMRTPVLEKSLPIDTYDVTPLPDSSMYDSDTEDAPRTRGKHIPLWAQGLLLKNALFHQFYNCGNVKEIFGTHIQPPDLSVIFQTQKRYYQKRTSSAIWHKPLF